MPQEAAGPVGARCEGLGCAGKRQGSRVIISSQQPLAACILFYLSRHWNAHLHGAAWGSSMSTKGTTVPIPSPVPVPFPSPFPTPSHAECQPRAGLRAVPGTQGRMGFASSCPTPQHVQGRGCTMPREGSAAGVQIKHKEWTGRVSVAITFVATTARPERSSVARLCLHFLLCCSFPPPQRCVGTRLAQAEKLSCCSTFCVSLSRGTDASCKKYLQARQSCLILQALFKPALR